MTTLSKRLDALTHSGDLCEEAGDGALRCTACAHRCLLREGRRGICQVRFNQGGQLRVPWGYVAGLQVDPIEKKPFAHFLPGSSALTFGMLGCNFHCDFCQNWLSSQALRDPQVDAQSQYLIRLTPEQVLSQAIKFGAQSIISSYNEPLITAEWAAAIFKHAQPAGLYCGFVSNGYATPEVLNYLKPYIHAYKIDLKTMQERQYRQLGGVLQYVLDSIVHARQLGLWVEVVTLVIPDFNDSQQELWDTARFITSVSADIPWHVTAFHPDYQRLGARPTAPETLQLAAEIGQEAGLHYVYAGNLPGRVGPLENTYCPNCTTLLIERRGYQIRAYHITAQGSCPKCGAAIAGIWPKDPSSVPLNFFGLPRWIH